MSDPLPAYSMVEVVRLFHPPEHYDGWQLNRRPLAVGDQGTVVEILNSGDDISYIVEACRADGVTEWVAHFEPQEIRRSRFAAL